MSHSPDHGHPVAATQLLAFIRRCSYRNPRSVAASEKLGTTVSWTTRNQENLISLLEVTHSVVSYSPWPGSVRLRAAHVEAFDYWPQMGIVSNRGEQTYLDVVGRRDEDDRRSIDFGPLLEKALQARGIRLLTVREDELSADPKLVVSRYVNRYAGWPTHDHDVTEELVRLLRSNGGGMIFRTLRNHVPAGELLLARACVMVMRRRLRLSPDNGRFDTSTVHLVPSERRA